MWIGFEGRCETCRVIHGFIFTLKIVLRKKKDINKKIGKNKEKQNVTQMIIQKAEKDKEHMMNKEQNFQGAKAEEDEE